MCSCSHIARSSGGLAVRSTLQWGPSCQQRGRVLDRALAQLRAQPATQCSHRSATPHRKQATLPSSPSASLSQSSSGKPEAHSSHTSLSDRNPATIPYTPPFAPAKGLSSCSLRSAFHCSTRKRGQASELGGSMVVSGFQRPLSSLCSHSECSGSLPIVRCTCLFPSLDFSAPCSSCFRWLFLLTSRTSGPKAGRALVTTAGSLFFSSSQPPFTAAASRCTRSH